MQRLTRNIWTRLFPRATTVRRAVRRPARKTYRPTLLGFEMLEDRCVPATGTGSISGFVFLDAAHNGALTAGDPPLASVSVTLSGTTAQGAAISLQQNTDGTGAYRFLNVLPGTYQVTSGPATGYVGGTATTGAGVGPFTLGAGQSLSESIGLTGGLDARHISLDQFLTSTTPADFAFGPIGGGSAAVNARADNAPVVSNAISNLSIVGGTAGTTIDLAGKFSDPDITNSQVTLNTSEGALKIDLFDTTAPQTVANFFDYINSGGYNNAIFSRLVSGFVLQGGGAEVDPTNGLKATPIINPPVPSEFGASNTAGTLAMGLKGNPSDPNSGTDEFFINLANNNASNTSGNNLDAQKFTVFGQVDASSQSVLNALSSTPTKSETSSAIASQINVNLESVPLKNYTGTNFPVDATSNFLTINSVTINRRDEFLTYSVTSSDPSLVTASLTNEFLALKSGSLTGGTATITVTATDTFGLTVQQSFTVTVTAPQPPVVNTVTVTPDSTTSATKLTAVPSATDPQNQPVTFTFQWQDNGKDINGQTTNVLDLTKVGTLAAGDKITVNVTPNDGIVTGTTFTSTPKIVNTVAPPTFQ